MLDGLNSTWRITISVIDDQGAGQIGKVRTRTVLHDHVLETLILVHVIWNTCARKVLRSGAAPFATEVLRGVLLTTKKDRIDGEPH